MPAALVDGQRITYPIRVVSKFDRDISLSKEISLVFSAPLLRMVVRPDKEIVLPGEVVTYRMALLNVGSATAKKDILLTQLSCLSMSQSSRFRLDFGVTEPASLSMRWRSLRGTERIHCHHSA